MTATAEDWAVQVSVKHGPVDERGNPLFMTNVRGKNVAEVLAHASELAALAGDINGYLDAFYGVGMLTQAGFQVAPVAPTTPAPATTVPHGSVIPASAAPAAHTGYVNGQVVATCPVNSNARHRYKEGSNSKGPWKGIMCSNTNPRECQPEWIRD